MDLLSEEIYYESTRRFFWTRVYVIEPDGSHRTVAIIGAGRAYINDLFKIPSSKQLEEKHKQQWLEGVIADLRKEFKTFEKGKIFRKAYAFSAEGFKNGLEFLEEVAP